MYRMVRKRSVRSPSSSRGDRQAHQLILEELVTRFRVGLQTIAVNDMRLYWFLAVGGGTNQVEIWFSRLEREVIARGIFTSVNDLARKLMRYIRAYSKTARPFKWKYSDLRQRILPC